MNKLKVLIGMEQSGVIRRAFRDLGYDAWSCDLLPSADNSPYHYQCDIFELLKKDIKWDLAIFHPVCQYLALSGVRWLYEDGKCYNIKTVPKPNLIRWKQMEEAALFFKRLWEQPIPKICIENPIMHGYAKKIIGIEHTQIIQPYMFGDPFQKSTLLWLKNLPKLVPTNIVSKGKMQVCKSGKVIPE